MWSGGLAYSGNGAGRISELAVRRARLVLRRVTVREYTVLICNQPTCQLSLLPSVVLEVDDGQGANDSACRQLCFTVPLNPSAKVDKCSPVDMDTSSG